MSVLTDLPPRNGKHARSIAAALTALLAMGAGGCDVGRATSVSATGSQGVTLDDVEIVDPHDSDACFVRGTVRNGTDRILTAMVLTAVGLGGNALGTVRVDSFNAFLSTNGAAPVVLPGTSYPFYDQLEDFHGNHLLTCAGIARIELTSAIFE